MVWVVVALVSLAFIILYLSMVQSSAHDIEIRRRITEFSVYHKQGE